MVVLILGYALQKIADLGCGRLSSSSRLSKDDQDSIEQPEDLRPFPKKREMKYKAISCSLSQK